VHLLYARRLEALREQDVPIRVSVRREVLEDIFNAVGCADDLPRDDSNDDEVCYVERGISLHWAYLARTSSREGVGFTERVRTGTEIVGFVAAKLWSVIWLGTGRTLRGTLTVITPLA